MGLRLNSESFRPPTAGELSTAPEHSILVRPYRSVLQNGQLSVRDYQADDFRAREVRARLNFGNRSHPLCISAAPAPFDRTPSRLNRPVAHPSRSIRMTFRLC